MTNKIPKWTEERTQNLAAIAGSMDNVVPVTTVKEAAETLATTVRSVASKLRKMGFEVESSTANKTKAFTEKDEELIRAFLEQNPGKFTFGELAVQLFNDPDMAKKIQGKILSMELTDMVKKTEPKIIPKAFSEEEEKVIESMVNSGEYIENIAKKLGKEINSVRGKCLAMMRSHGISMPKQEKTASLVKTDALEELGDIKELLVEDIATKIGKTVRGVKAMLTHRGLSAADYDGEKKAAKIAEKKNAT